MMWRKRVNYRPARHDERTCLECASFEVHGPGEFGLCFGESGLKQAPLVRDCYHCNLFSAANADESARLNRRHTVLEAIDAESARAYQRREGRP